MGAIRRTKDAKAIRFGIQRARDVVARRRQQPQLTPWAFRGAGEIPLWERAYHREISAMVRDGRIRPPRGPSGVGSRKYPRSAVPAHENGRSDR